MNWAIALIGLFGGFLAASVLRRWLPGMPGRRWRYLQPYHPARVKPRAGAK